MAWNSSDSSFALSPTSGLDAKCVGTVTGTLTWVPTSGMDNTTDPPPTQVIVTETGYARFSGGGVHTDHGTLNDGWPADAPPYSPDNIYGPHYYYSASGTHYEVKDGTTGTVTVGPFSLNASTPAVTDVNAYDDDLAVAVNINFLPASVIINPNGATQDATTGKYNILVGQGFSPKLEGAPTSGTTYAWTVSGTTFQDWQPTTPAAPNATPPTPANPNASYYVDGSGVLTNVSAHWYWNDPGPSPTDETVTCAATVTPDDGKNAPYTVNVTQKVTVYVPKWTAFGIGGYVQVNSGCPDETQGLVAFWAGPYISPTGSYDTHHGGMDWTATCTTPQKPVAFGTGTLELVQLATPNRSYTTNTKPPVPHTQQAAKGLDSRYPYPSLSPSAYVEGGPAYGAFDDPRIPTDGVNAGSVSMAESFDDYLLYQPPGNDIRWVPLANFTWTTNGSATIPKSGFWVDYSVKGTPYDVAGAPSDKAGTVKPSTNPPTASPFTPWNTHPKWMLINTFPAF